MFISDFIFAEFCYALMKRQAPNAQGYMSEIEQGILHASPKLIKEAAAFRYTHKKKKLSITDCISYIMARELGVNFLTGDIQFKEFENVEFVK